MVRPAAFGFNEETAASNAFQQNDTSLSKHEISEKARIEFDAFVEMMRRNGISVLVVEDAIEPHTPDAVFPNNWFSTHEDGTVVLYPMFAQVRRKEREKSALAQLETAFEVQRILHLEHLEAENCFLEGTGSLILDRVHRICYACLSPRTNWQALQQYCEHLNYEAVVFHATDKNGLDIYHTNVMMAIGETFAVMCSETITNLEERENVRQKLTETGKEIVEITWTQMERFAGNMLQVRNASNETFLVMSQQARASLSDAQVAQIEAHTKLLSSPLETIEKYGGGSARCMLAEIFLTAR